jgi:uncharacterized membrane protein
MASIVVLRAVELKEMMLDALGACCTVDQILIEINFVYLLVCSIAFILGIELEETAILRIFSMICMLSKCFR